MTWNWSAADAAFLTDFVFIAGLLLQTFWVEGTANRLSSYFSVDADSKPLSQEKIDEHRRYVLDRLSLDADRVQVAATLLTIPFSAILLLNLDKPTLAVLFAGSMVVVGALFGVLSRLPPERNRFRKYLSWISLWSAIVLALYTVAVPLVTPSSAVH